MNNYKLTIEDGVVTWIETEDENGKHIDAALFIPKEAVAFSSEAWIFLDYNAEAIIVDEDNPVFSSAHNCLLSKDRKTLIKVCKNSDVSALTSIETIAPNAFNDLCAEPDELIINLPDTVTSLGYRALASFAVKAHVTIPASVHSVDALALMIHSDELHVTFEGDPCIETGIFGIADEAEDSNLDILKNMPSVVCTKKENITVSCPANSRISAYCKKYGIREV